MFFYENWFFLYSKKNSPLIKVELFFEGVSKKSTLVTNNAVYDTP